ncbi:unnamed protein product [Diatraea saccharalis]|uniref:Uncharacterized protein n=1 Tax=Diatraea saccharalis TaxID=40085 RepID=A0A9N9W6X0_9NEOP|nr:unnamed protein product [Diatraea saccharalis]
MPHRKKKCLKKKKKKITSPSLPKKKSEPLKDIAGVSGIGINRHPSIIFKRRRAFDKCGVKRLLSPFNRFENNEHRIADIKKRKMPLQKTNHSPGLSPKEKSYIICSCQTRSSRYVKLKCLASTAIKENKIFSIYGSCNAVRKALVERGWVEKIPPDRMNLSKVRNGTFTNKSDLHGELERLLLSNLVDKYNPNFIWRVKDEHYEPPLIDMTKECSTVVNKLRTDALWTTKQGLCSSMKRNYWFYIEDVAEVNGPRSYNSYDFCEIEEFIKDYKITAFVVDYAADNKSSTGKFECIYRQPITTPRYGTAAELFLRGYTLPLDYFYKGKIEIKESYEDPDIGKEYDIKNVLSKLKQFYDTDIMITPEDETEEDRASFECENLETVSCSHNTESENELDVAATVITEQLDEIIDKVSSGNELTIERAILSDDISSYSKSNNNLAILDKIKSVTDIKAFLKSKCNCIDSRVIMNAKSVFNFNKLDDRSKRKNSLSGVHETVKEIVLPKDVYDCKSKTTKNEIIRASSKILTFIKQKEKEYLESIKI